jgi:hypothetical protein
MHLFYFSNKGSPSQEDIEDLVNLHRNRLQKEVFLFMKCGYLDSELAMTVLEGQDETDVCVVPLSVFQPSNDKE